MPDRPPPERVHGRAHARTLADLGRLDIAWLRIARELERLYPQATVPPGRWSATETIRRWERATGMKA